MSKKNSERPESTPKTQKKIEDKLNKIALDALKETMTLNKTGAKYCRWHWKVWEAGSIQYRDPVRFFV